MLVRGGGEYDYTPRGGEYSPPPPDTWDTTGYGQQAGGMHPTGMRSCILQCVQLTLTSPSEAEEFLGMLTFPFYSLLSDRSFFFIVLGLCSQLYSTHGLFFRILERKIIKN